LIQRCTKDFLNRLEPRRRHRGAPDSVLHLTRACDLNIHSPAGSAVLCFAKPLECVRVLASLFTGLRRLKAFAKHCCCDRKFVCMKVGHTRHRITSRRTPPTSLPRQRCIEKSSSIPVENWISYAIRFSSSLNLRAHFASVGFLFQSLSSRDQLWRRHNYPSWFGATFAPRTGDTAQPHWRHPRTAGDVRVLGYSIDLREIVARAVQLCPSERGETRLGFGGESVSLVFGVLVWNQCATWFVKSVYSFKTDRINVHDDFRVELSSSTKSDAKTPRTPKALRAKSIG